MPNNGHTVYASQETSDILIYQSKFFFFIYALDIPTTVIVIYLTYAYCVIANDVEITF